MKTRINSFSFDIDLGKTNLFVRKMALDITDNSAVAKRRGRPNGMLQGDCEASGTLTIDVTDLGVLSNFAKNAKSWQEIETFDISCNAKAGDQELKVEVFGVKLKLNKILDFDESSTDETMIEVPFSVTSEHFVKINGVPYMKELQD